MRDHQDDLHGDPGGAFEHKPEMTFIGFHTSIRPEEANRKCPAFWERDYNRKYTKLRQTMKPENALEAAILENQIGLFAICNETETDNEYWIAGRYIGGEVPEGLSLFTFPESDWAVFEAKGPPCKPSTARCFLAGSPRRAKSGVPT